MRARCQGLHPDATARLRFCDPADCASQSLLSITPNLPCVLILEIGNVPSYYYYYWRRKGLHPDATAHLKVCNSSDCERTCQY